MSQGDEALLILDGCGDSVLLTLQPNLMLMTKFSELVECKTYSTYTEKDHYVHQFLSFNSRIPSLIARVGRVEGAQVLINV